MSGPSRLERIRLHALEMNRNALNEPECDYARQIGRGACGIAPHDSGMGEGFLEGDISYGIIGAFYEVYNRLGYGFLEHVYTASLERELRSREFRVAREVYVRVYYKGEEVALQRVDMIVNDTVVVEIKATLDLHKGARRQLRNYLRSTRLEVGLLFHIRTRPGLLSRSLQEPSSSGP